MSNKINLFNYKLQQRLFAGDYVGTIVSLEEAPEGMNKQETDNFYRLTMDVDNHGRCSTFFNFNTEQSVEWFMNPLYNQFPHNSFSSTAELIEHCKHNKVYFHVTENVDTAGRKWYNWKMWRRNNSTDVPDTISNEVLAENATLLDAVF